MIIVFYNKRARVSAFPLTICVVREKIPFSKEGERNTAFRVLKCNPKCSPQKNFYDDVTDRTHSSKHRKKKKKRIY